LSCWRFSKKHGGAVKSVDWLQPHGFTMFRSLRERADLGIVFVREGDEPPPQVTELPDGSADVDMRYLIPVPSDDLSGWNEQMCAQAFDALAQTSSRDSYPDLAPFFASIELSFEEFDRWRRARGYPKPPFWGGPAASTLLQKPKRGRPPEYSWEQVLRRLHKHAEENGPIGTYEERLQKCTDLAASLHPLGKTPDDSTIRGAIKKYGLDQPPICRPTR
jgi:hypothetical protein